MRRGPALTLAVIVFAACTDGIPVPTLTDPEVPPIASAISDADPTADPQSEYPIYFLAPLVKGRSPVGEFNPNLAPEIEVCELDMGMECTGDPVAYFGPGVFHVDPVTEHYQFNWDTDIEGPLDHTKLYRVNVVMGDIVLGYFDINPQDPSGSTPGEDEETIYAFRLGETLPIKFWLSGIACDVGSAADNAGTVVECDEWTVFRDQGADLALYDYPLAPIIGVSIPKDGLPASDPVVTFRLERIELAQGQKCFEGLDIPTFGPCLRITTIPETFAAPLELPSIIGLCSEKADLRGAYKGNPASIDNVQMFRKPEVGDELQALANTSTKFCDIPEDEPTGIMGTLARILRPVTRLVAPQPLRAIHLGRGGELGTEGGVTSYSYYTWGLPGQLVTAQGDNQVGETGTLADPAPVAQVLDDSGYPVLGATVRFEVTDGDGFVSPASAVTGPDGYASADWTFGPYVGANQLRAWGYGLFGEDDTFTAHEYGWPVEVGSAYFDAFTCSSGDGHNYGTAVIDGSLGEDEWACALQEPYYFEANLGSGGAPAALYWMNDAENLYLALKVQGTVDRSNGIRFDFNQDPLGVPQPFDDAFNYYPETGLHEDQYLTEKCSQSSQSGCGELDTDANGTNDGMAAFDNANGVFTVYELMKPLTGDPEIDFALEPGDVLNLFGTLRMGNGAKGNTQFPGFREWLTITIAPAMSGS